MGNLSVHDSTSDALEWDNATVCYRKTLIMVPLERKVPTWNRKLNEAFWGMLGPWSWVPCSPQREVIAKWLISVDMTAMEGGWGKMIMLRLLPATTCLEVNNQWSPGELIKLCHFTPWMYNSVHSFALLLTEYLVIRYLMTWHQDLESWAFCWVWVNNSL